MNLLSKLHRNSILTGPVESYCLVCGCLLRSEEESYSHIHEQSHADKLSSTPPLADHNDCFIKVKEGYYCQYCNIILPTIKRVGLHVTDAKHKNNKIALSIYRQNGVILAFDSVIINERSWNGLDGSTCSVCNEDYDDEEHHKIGVAHVLNVIQAKCEFGETYIYRKVDEELFFCLICNAILPLLEKETHHQSEKHTGLFEKSKTEGSAVRDLNVEKNNVNTASLSEQNNNTTKTPVNEAKITKDTKSTVKDSDNKPKTQDNKSQNGSAVDVNDSRTTSSKNTKEPATINTQNTPVFNIQASQKVTLDVETNATINAVKAKPKPEDKSKEFQVKSSDHVPKTVAKTEIKNSDTVKTKESNVKVNNEDKIQANDKNNPFYKYLEACDFIIKGHDGTYCALCDLDIADIDTKIHSLGEHHRALFSKHVARKIKKTNATIAVNKETVSVDQNKNAAKKHDETKSKADTPNNTDKVVALKALPLPPIPLKFEKEPESNPINNNTTVNQPNTAPQNETNEKSPKKDITASIAKKDNEPNNNQSNESNTAETKSKPADGASQNKKAAKKNKKKVAKAKVSQTNALPKEIEANATAIPEIHGQGTSEAETKDGSCSKESTKTILNETMAKENALEIAENDLKTEKLQSFIKSVSHIEGACDVIINGKHVLGILSFFLVIRVEDYAQCIACNEVLLIDDIKMHVNSDWHKNHLEDCAVVVSLESEFIRKVNAQGYHCGYCNVVTPNWDNMKLHLTSYGHNNAKTSAMWRLYMYQPILVGAEPREVRSILAIISQFTE